MKMTYGKCSPFIKGTTNIQRNGKENWGYHFQRNTNEGTFKWAKQQTDDTQHKNTNAQNILIYLNGHSNKNSIV